VGDFGDVEADRTVFSTPGQVHTPAILFTHPGPNTLIYLKRFQVRNLAQTHLRAHNLCTAVGRVEGRKIGRIDPSQLPRSHVVYLFPFKLCSLLHTISNFLPSYTPPSYRYSSPGIGTTRGNQQSFHTPQVVLHLHYCCIIKANTTSCPTPTLLLCNEDDVSTHRLQSCTHNIQYIVYPAWSTYINVHCVPPLAG
jgi:hypothetical protein